MQITIYEKHKRIHKYRKKEKKRQWVNLIQNVPNIITHDDSSPTELFHMDVSKVMLPLPHCDGGVQ